MASVPTRLANHRHPLEVMRLGLQLYLHAGLGCRGVSSVLRLLAGYLPPGVPVATTVLNWCCRLGLGVLRRALARHDDWIFIIDHTVALGELKCLVVLGIRASRLPETGYSPSHGDMTVLAVEVMENSTGLRVAAVLEQVSARTGVPVQIVCDHGRRSAQGHCTVPPTGAALRRDLRHLPCGGDATEGALARARALACVPATGGHDFAPIPADRLGVSAAAAPAHQSTLHGDRRPYQVGAVPARLSRSGRFQPHRAGVRVQRRRLGAAVRSAGQAPCRAFARPDRTALRHARGVVLGALRAWRHGVG